MKRPNAWNDYSDQQAQQVEDFCRDYMGFISRNKTEREFTAEAIRQARQAGYVSLEEAISRGRQLQPGDRVYASNRGKTLMLLHLGTEPLERGLNILGAHVDSPRLDVKQNPLDQKSELASLDTHYYGGIKKYQWVTIPLAIHGVVARKDGSVVNVTVGEDPSDPVFVVSDLLIHLAKDQMTKTASDVIDGEMLDVLVGNRPLQVDAADAKGDASADADSAVKARVLGILAQKYGVDEEDFLSAELEVVPAGPARDLGFDRSMILGYGQDDSSCAYPSLRAQLELDQTPARTAVTLLVDKEEIGSVGSTGMTSRFFENVLAEVIALATGQDSMLTLRRCLAASDMLSSDVSAGFDPSFADRFEAKNSSYLGHGLTFNKYTGARGKSGSNDADAEYLAKIRRCMDDAGVHFQTAELGRVDAGGGGTIAYILAEYCTHVVDCGVPVLSMHAPWEVTSKVDVYEAYRGYKAFLQLA